MAVLCISLSYILIYITLLNTCLTQTYAKCCCAKEDSGSLYNEKIIYNKQKEYSSDNNENILNDKIDSTFLKIPLNTKRNIDLKKSPKLEKKKNNINFNKTSNIKKITYPNNINNSNKAFDIEKISSCEEIENIKYEDIDQKNITNFNKTTNINEITDTRNITKFNNDDDIKNIDNTKDPDDLKRLIKCFFTDSNIDDINSVDLFRFFFHYRSEKNKFLDKDLHYILFELLSSSVDNEKLIELLKYRLGLDDNNMEDVNDSIVFQQLNNENCIYYNSGDAMLYFKNKENTNIEYENIKNELSIIILDLPRTICKDYNSFSNIKKDESNNIYFVNNICKILVNFILNHPELGGYAQGMNFIAKFFVFLTTKEVNGELIFNNKLAYNLFYRFLIYNFDNIVFKKEYKNGKINLIDYLDDSKMKMFFSNNSRISKNIFDKFSILSNSEKCKVNEDLKSRIKMEIETYFISMFLTYSISLVGNFNVSKSIILLLLLVNNHSLFLDILSIYAIRTAEDIYKKIGDKNFNQDNLSYKFITLQNFLDNISNYK